LDARGFPALGTTGNFAAGDERFYAAAGATMGHDATDRLIYDTSTGNLYYDPDGSGGGASQLVAMLAAGPGGPAASLTANDIWLDNGASGQVINGTAGNDSLVGSNGNDTINGLDGNDPIDG